MNDCKVKANKTEKLASRERSRLIFYISLLVLPLLQFTIFYIYVNINTVKMTFWNYEMNPEGLGYVYKWVGFDNFVSAFNILLGKSYMILNSLWAFFLSLVISVPL